MAPESRNREPSRARKGPTRRLAGSSPVPCPRSAPEPANLRLGAFREGLQTIDRPEAGDAGTPLPGEPMRRPEIDRALSRRGGGWALFLLLPLALLHAGCARVLVDQTASMMVATAPAIEMEEDPALAEAATLSNLTMIEGMLLLSPRNETLLMMATRSFAGYGAAFVEPAWSLRDDYFSDDYLYAQKRLQGLYRRSRDTGLRWIELHHPEVARLLREPTKDAWVEELPAALAKLGLRDVPALFWTAQAWALLIRADDENVLEIANLGKIEAIMHRVYELDPDYNFGAVHLFFAMRNTSLGREWGGDLEEARRHFANAIAVTGGRYLAARYLHARDYCRAIQDRDCFVQGLEEVAAADPDLLPEQRLANTLATIWARQWLARVDDFF